MFTAQGRLCHGPVFGGSVASGPGADLPAVALSGVLDDRQPDAATARFAAACLVYPIETFKDPVKLAGFNAVPEILH